MAVFNSPLVRFADGGAIGGISAYFLTDITPLSGFYFGGIFCLVRVLVDEGLSCLGNSVVAKITRFALSVIVAAAVSAATANLCGLVVTFRASQLIIAAILSINAFLAVQQRVAQNA